MSATSKETAGRADRRYVFDLDGTLVDAFEDLLAAVNHALSRVDARSVDMDELRSFVGRGAGYLVSSACGHVGVPQSRVRDVLSLFRASYRARCTVHTRFYDGVPELLRALGPDRAAILTNKPRGFTLQILREHRLREHVGPVVGGDSLPVRKPDPATLRFVAHLWGAEPGSLTMVGDSDVDFELARQAGIASIGVSWNGKSSDSLLEAGAQRVVARPRELLAETSAAA